MIPKIGEIYKCRRGGEVFIILEIEINKKDDDISLHMKVKQLSDVEYKKDDGYSKLEGIGTWLSLWKEDYKKLNKDKAMVELL